MTTTRAALYARVSTDDQVQRFGLASQFHEMRVYGTRKGYQVSDELSDDGVSGATIARPALTRLRDGVRAGRFDVVVVHAPDRLSRNLVHQLVLLDEFKRAGVRVEFVTTPTDDTAEGRLLLNVSGVIAEFEREKIRERTNRGKREKARRGLYVEPGHAPYGYRPDPARPGRLVIYEPEADVIRTVFTLCIDQKLSTNDIITELRRRGVELTRRRVRKILAGEGGYDGTTYFNRKRSMPDGTKQERPRDEWIAIPVPPIVDRDRIAAAAAQRRRNFATLVGRPSTRYLLRGLIVCSACGRRYRGSPVRGVPHYKHAHQDGAQDRCALRFAFGAVELEATVRASVAKALSDPATLRRGVEAYESRRGATDVELKSAVAHLERQIAKIRKDERRLIGLAVADGEQRDMVEAKLAELAKRRQALAEQLQDAEGKVAAHDGANRADAIDQLTARARRGLSKLTDAGWRQLLLETVDVIRVRPDRRVEIHGLIVDGSTTYDVPSKWAGRARGRPGAGGVTRPRATESRTSGATESRTSG